MYPGDPYPEQDMERFQQPRKMSSVFSQAMSNTPTSLDPETTTSLTSWPFLVLLFFNFINLNHTVCSFCVWRLLLIVMSVRLIHVVSLCSFPWVSLPLTHFTIAVVKPRFSPGPSGEEDLRSEEKQSHTICPISKTCRL